MSLEEFPVKVRRYKLDSSCYLQFIIIAREVFQAKPPVRYKRVARGRGTRNIPFVLSAARIFQFVNHSRVA
ncbi:hypothetical protein X777_04445 [Ooceraea biroi]|uniref:Uncharacterized protein n=1 Tax=Ooceraea biroi TaxID=2015173 RepID=A0A026WG06_OOCBI|nr:hypothetical protein X777_04445 [Ooceraea biroi]